MSEQALFIHSDAFFRYRFHDDHPFNNQRLELTLDLIRSLNLLKDHHLYEPTAATDKELYLTHDREYVEVVKTAHEGTIPESRLLEFGLSTEDNPVFDGMHDIAALITGGTLTAVKQVMSGARPHALNLSGGLHHALRAKASGFCVYNDASVAIAYLREKYDARVMYIDTDAHHGDGVQWSFYGDPDVMTVSIHETGRYLFPGTGNVYERGHDAGFGACINIPVDAFTEDDSWMEAFERVIPSAIRKFQPDIILSQHGCDAHHYDPLTHLSATIRIYREMPRLLHEWAHEWCDGRWVAVGGGGYDIWRVVPRAWTYLWAEMSDQPLGEVDIPAAWRKRWQRESPVELPHTLHDPEGIVEPIPRREEITQKNRTVVDQVLQYL
ncbi:acetoin utilization protein AcuC [Marinithermofilum abyssi]|uniref:Acetoin utilization protein AcuC n=1 Tax=Marinithermofilum abyssi TaxID=1571185 RepID=A0A8J2Y9D0_9BACL|nr:acetoin utilization protein AcuC [Marinithermofilum abyssi]GGE19860.1 acetoin utilization protein AcuC [Marinithermofilum abyssi]